MSDPHRDRAARAATDAGPARQTRDEVADVYPLAPLQQAMLLRTELDPRAGLYLQQFVITLREPLDVPAFRTAWQRLVDRHPALRTSFLLDASPEPLQRVHARLRLAWSAHDWRGLPAAEQEAGMSSFLLEDRRTPFDPASPPLSRFTLFRTADEEYRLVWSSHHALLDGYARRILLKEVFAEYEALRDGRSPAAEAPAPPFGEYVAWQRAAGERDARAFWEEALRGFAAPAEMSLEAGRGEARERHRFQLSEQLTEELQRLARREEVTLNAVLQAAWALLLSRYTGSMDVAFGATRACRRGGFAGAERIVGMLSNTVPVRLRVDEARPVAWHLEAARTLWVRMRPHERTHLGRIQEWIGLPAGSPMFETLLGFETESTQDIFQRLGGGWSRRSFELHQWTSYPLTVVAHGGARITFQATYDPARFGTDAVRRMERHLAAILEAFAADARQPLARIELPEDPAPGIPAYAAAAGGLPLPALPLHRLFEAQAARTPGATAVSFGDERLDYRELNRRADRLAHRLAALGACPESRVGLCAERGTEMIVAILAILKAGAAYVPLDPHAPPDRIAFIAEDAGLRVVAAQPHLAERLGPLRVPVCPLDGLAACGEADPPPPPVDVGPEGLAYVIYTSGSTGRPKGVEVSHHNVVRLFSATRPWFGFGEGDVWTLFHSYAFDFSVWEIWGALLHGGRLVVVPYLTSRSPEDFLRLLVRERVTVLNQTPSAFRQLAAAEASPGASAELALRWVVFGGEALEPGSLRGWVERHGDERPRLVNMYGITETTVHVTFRPITREDVERGSVSPVGVAIPDLRVHVLDGALRRAPVGVPGEMFVGGEGVARGYLERPELTAWRFVPDPFSGVPGARMYRSGDRARRLGTGELEYLGRLDEQVKIRGFRIEPGEVEAILRTHPAVGDCVVAVREDAPGERVLVGYVVGAPGGAAPSPAELRAHAGARLPEYMVPSAFVALARIPLTVNGKTDRRALPAPERGVQDGYVAPRTPVEEALSAVFAGVLRAERVGVRDGFFEMGGHSLLLMQLVSRIRAALGVEVPLGVLFDAPTVECVAAYVERTPAGSARREAAAIRPVPRDRPLLLSFAQERLWFMHRLDPGSAAYNVPFSFRLEGPLQTGALRLALEFLVRRHEALRTVYREHGGQPRQHVLPPARLPLPVVDLGALPHGEALASRLAEEEARRPFDLECGPLLRAALVRLGPESHLLLATMHHVACDGWSVGILTGELGACYAALARGREPALPPLPVQYADYAAWQRDTLDAAALEPALDYWRGHLAGAGPLALPADRTRPAGTRRRGERVRIALPGSVVEAVRELARRTGATPYMVLLSAFKALLSRHEGREDVVVGTPVAGREHPDTQALAGFFVNTLALRTRVAQDEGFLPLLERVRETTLAGYAHQHAPYERVAAELQPGREAGEPLFNVMFAYNPAAEGAPALPGVDAVRVPVERGAAKFDLMLSLDEGPAGIAGAWELDAELFDRATVEAMARRFVHLLEGALAAPHAPVGDLPLLPERERAALLAACSGPAGEVPEGTFHAAFSAQAARTPDAPAVVFRGRSWSYAETDRRSNQLARALRERGIGPEARVGLCVERGFEAVLGILGILKAGGAYVPLDPAHPAERLAVLVEACGASVVLAQERTAKRVPAGVETLRLDAGLASVEEESDAPLEERALPESAAYVIHTSGSTGTPKGVVVQHRSLLNLERALRRAVYARRAPGGPARVSVNGPLTFDTSVKQLVQLLSGSALHVVPEEVRYDGRALAGWLREERVEVLDCTPAQLRLLLAGGLLETAGPALTDVLVAGEAVDEPTWEQLAAVPAIEFHDLYGPTECTVDATACRVRDFPDRPTIGVPLHNVRTYLLDGRLNPVPAGVPGEVYVGGEGVARGYLGLADVTAGRFLPDPFAPGAGARMYRTGDRARLRADGALEFLGRADDQVKIRGFRIEPGEIESALCRHPGVRQAAVVGVEAAPGDLRLAAYVALEGEPPPAVRELREHLGASLPAYMVPTAWVVLDALPLSAHGKTDRRALPAPEWGDESQGYVAPRTPTEEALARVWSDVLRVRRVGVEDDFFALGGHSLLVARVAARVRDALGVEVPLRLVFDAPTVAGAARWIDAAWQAAGRAELQPLRRVPRDGSEPLPLSSAQQRLWFLHRLEPESPAYNMAYALRLGGALDARALRRSLGELVRRHETLRTRFAARGDEVEQVIDAPAAAALPCVDLRALPAGERAAGAARLAGAEAARPFDLEAGPVLRFLLLRLAGREHHLLATLHHVAGDGWSVGVLFRELGALYDAFARGEPSPLAELPVQYADFAAWQRERLAGGAAEQALGYWRGRLGDAPSLLELPTDRPRSASPGSGGAACSLLLPETLASALRALSRREGATLFTTLLAGWQALLARWSGQDDLVVGAPFSSRPRTEFEGLVGFFVNTLPLRTDLRGDPTAAELLRRVHETVLEAQTHQELPLERLVEEVHPGAAARHSPLFQVLFTLQAPDDAAPRMEGLATERLPVGTGSAKFDLTLVVEEEGETLRPSLTFRTALFDRATAERLLAHYLRVLAGMAEDPGAVVGCIDLLDDGERRLLMAPAAAPATHRCVHELFAAQAERVPENVALVFGEERMSYLELHRRSDELACLLAAAGVGPDVRVGVCMERAPELVVGLLGVLKAGGAYVPLDPAYPPERLAFMLADARVPVLLVQERLRGRLPEFAGAVVSLDGPAAPAATAAARPAPAVTPDHLAYVIYTSGSTGTPKGTEVPHRAIPGFFTGVDYARFGEEQVLLQHSSTSWDALTLELWPALLTGGTCVLFPGASSEPRELGEQVRRHGVTTLWLTSAYFNLIVDTCPEVLSGVRQVMTGGEAGSVPHVRRALELYPELRLVNGYGPSECTVFASCHPVPPDFDAAVVPIGTPVGDRRVYLVDRGLTPVPGGVAGELCVGGPAVARGYLDRPGLTAERFVPDPFCGEPGARMYRSGDRARRRADGLLEFVGRADLQVKIRGFRVEPGEVETVLAGHPQVRDAVVVVRPAAGGEARLVGYVTAHEGAPPGAGEVRAWLRERLPEHMVPSALVVLESMPLTPHGKADRRALPSPDDPASGADAYAPPRTPTEEALAEVWAEVLGRGRIGAADDFFELGGHSLLATRVVSRVRRSFGVELPLRAVFEAPTLGSMAARVDALLRGGAGAELPPLAPVPRSGGPLPLSFAQRRLWFLDRLEPGRPTYNIPGALRLRGAPDVEALARALQEIAARHETLRTVFLETEDGPAQVVSPPGSFALVVQDLAALAPAAREPEALRRAREEAELPFDLETGPLFRARLLRLAADDHVLVVTLHHVAGDGWSRGVLYRELEALYGAFARGGASPLAGLPVQYADYAVWQRETLAGERLERQLAWWRARLAGAPAVLELPADRPAPGVRSGRGGAVEVAFAPELAGALRGLARREGATLFMALLAAWQLLLRRYSGQECVVVGTPIAGRTQPETEGLIGFFANTLALRADFGADPAFAELLAAVRDGALGAYAHQDLPFERLVEELAPERSLSHTPLFQAMFALQSAPSAPPRLPGVEVAPLRLGTATAKFDLTLALAEGEGGLSGVLEYAADLFDAATVERMAGHLRVLLEGVAAAPGTRASAVELLDPAERRRLLAEWSGTAREHPEGGCVYELFAAQARRTPDAVAVVHRRERVTYAELARRANRLAHALRRRGVGPEAPVGVCLGRTPGMVAALLAVLAAGGAYVPLDPAQPRERIARVLEDASAALVLTESALAGRLPAGTPVLALDRLREELAREPEHPPETGVGPENPACLIFTSGSTGRPKGVVVRHASAVTLLRWLRDTVPDGERESVLGSTSITFDVSVAEVFGTLCWGGKLVLVENALELASVPAAEEVRLATMVPTAAAELLRAGGIPSSVCSFNLAGEALSPDLARALYGLAHVSHVRNLYGPTEDTVYSTWSRVEPGAGEVRIGRPVADTRAYVLDAALAPAPTGVAGELHLAGGGLARGYSGRPDLTAERFLPCPFGPPGSRMYRTGDRARWLASGELEYLGRIDEQLKVRGFRIEPGEVENALEEHPGVRRAVVVAHQAGSGADPDRRLAAFYLPQGGITAADELRAHLRERLPEYMVPSAFVALDSFPLTGSGKVDRGRLPTRDLPAATERYVAPRTPAEEVVAAAFAETLGVPRAGAHDDFFALGGHSLLAARLVARIHRETGVRLPLHALFARGTVERLASLLGAERSAVRPPLVALRAGSGRPFFCVHAVDGHVLSYRALAARLDGGRPFYGLQAAGVDDGDPPGSVEEMAAAYVAALREVQPRGPYLLGGWSMGGVVAFEAARRLRAAGEEVELLALLDVPRAVRAPGEQDEAELLEDALRELPGGVDADHLDRLLRVRRANLEALRAYVPGAYDGRAVLLEAAERAASTPRGRRLLDWESLCAGGLEVHTVPGDHFTMLREPHVRAVAERLGERLGGGRG